ncbi:DUF86 domain-containing protein [uncultured Draconibacterium sp.]|uniref:type VII toxin-antitoxin system HepT family RNase toxin n=1 Tax=uncultured Draconibacterium sp. TaxID=1573823 RepID=UPI003216D600
MDEILINKSATIDRCIKRIMEDYQDDFLTNFTKQDAVILNIERACQTSIDIATHIIRIKKLGIPQSHRDAFDKLEKAKLIPKSLSENLKSMAGFRNIAVHDYSSINIEVVINIIEHHLSDFQEFAAILNQ